MQVLAKLSAFPIFLRRPPSRARGACHAPQLDVDEAAADAAYRVTDRLRRWTAARHFRDVRSAWRYAEAMGGIVWERYVGPTGAVNWWSLNDEECVQKCGAGEAPEPEPACGAAAHAAELSVV